MKKPKISIHDYSKHNHIIQFYVSIYNPSTKTISVSSISVLNNGCIHHCELIPKKIRDIHNTPYTTPFFPVDVPAKSSFHCFLEFLGCSDIQLAPGKSIVFRVDSTQGRKDRCITLGDTSYYLHTKN